MRFRRTAHDHNPVNDAMGNVEAFDEIMRVVKDSSFPGTGRPRGARPGRKLE